MITDQVINQCVNQLKKTNPELIILFGSAAVDPRRANDLDLFMVKNTKKNRIDRSLDIKYRLLEDVLSFTPIDLVVYTPKEFVRAKKENRMFLEEILARGKVVYEKH